MRRFIYLLAGICGLLALVLLFDLVPFLRGGFGWQWPYVPVALTHMLPLLIVAVIYVVGAGLLLQRTQRDGWLLIWSFLGIVTLSLAGLYLRSHDLIYELFVRTASGVTTGQHLAGVEINWSDPNWVKWPVTVQPFVGRSGHIVLSGPALPLWYGLLNAVFEQLPTVANPLHQALVPYQCRNYDLLAYTPAQWASAWFGMLMPVWAALSVWPLYYVARRLAGQATARLAVSWWSLVPALVLFTPTWNTVYPLVAVVAFWLLMRGDDEFVHPIWLVLAGLLTGLLTFANFSLLPLLGLLGFYTLLRNLWLKKQNLIRPLIVGLWFTVGLIVPWLIFWLVSGLTPLDLFNFSMSNHLILDRPYVPWLWLHFWEWTLLTGVPLVGLWLWWALRRERTPVGALALALFLTLGLLIVAGVARGETGRVWLFFAPFVLICAAAGLDSLKDATKRPWFLISGSQIILLSVVAGTWMLINAPNMSPPPESPGPTVTNQPVDATFGSAFELIGWDAQQMDDHVQLNLNWQVLERVATPYWFSALLVAPDGSLPQDSQIWQALDTRYPTSCWQPGEQVGDSIGIVLPADAEAGEWWLSLSVFADKNDPENRMHVILPDGSEDNQVGLGPLHIR